jgi:hypothetical protein
MAKRESLHNIILENRSNYILLIMKPKQYEVKVEIQEKR